MGRAVSPDGRKAVTIQDISDENADGFPAIITATDSGRTFRTRIRFGLNTDVLWSPDSKAFAVTGSRDGANGLYLTDVFVLRQNGLTKIPLSKIVWNTFGHPVRCGWPEYPNVAAIVWLKDSSRLLVAAQIIGHSVCDSNRTFKAYEVDVSSQKIVAKYGQLEAKKVFKADIGDWLSGAPDECIRDPRSCWVSTNHSEDTPH